MRRKEVGRCPESPAGKHHWLVVTSKEQAAQGFTHYICQNCKSEAMEPSD
jgi:hypothetical protein